MTTQLARAHGHSNRAKARSILDCKPVFKSVLENPFDISWPSIRENTQNIILARLVAVLAKIPHPYRKTLGKQGNAEATGEIASASQALDQESTTSPLLVGVNAVTRALEYQLRTAQKHVILGNPSQHHGPALPISVVFVCCADVDPPALIAHIPHLVAGCNAQRNVMEHIKLVPLPKGSEQTISQILGIRRAAVVAFRCGSLWSEADWDILASLPLVSAPWLCPSDTEGTPRLVPTHIKQFHTTAPKDMRAAREQRSKARAAAKKNSQLVHRKSRITLTTAETHAP